MKKNSIIIAILITVVILVTFVNYLIYNDYYNRKVIDIANQIVEENPEIDSRDIARILKNPEHTENNVLHEYGYAESDLYLVGDIESRVAANVGINVAILILISIVIFAFILKKNKKRQAEIKKLIEYLDRINKGIYDIDIEKYDESELSKLRNSIYQTMVVLKEQSEGAKKEKLVLKDNITDISHQLNTPLTSVSLMLESLIDDEEMPTSRKEDYLRKIETKIEKISDLIQVMLKLSRLDASVIEFNRENVKVSMLLDNAKNSLEELCRDKNINIEINPSGGTVIPSITASIPSGAKVTPMNTISINVDPKWQEEALTNIIKNCVEYSKENGIIAINISDNNFYTMITVQDEGIGIKKEDISKVFERYHKTNNSKGFGIGLNLAKTIIEKDGGMIEVKSVENEYTKFIIKYIK